MREKWRELSLLQRALLVILAGMILGFGIATPIVSTRKGIEYGDTLLRFTREGEVSRYAGEIDGKRAEFTVYPGGTVEYRWGEEVYGPYQVEGDPAAPDNYAGIGVRRVRIRLGDQTLFEGRFSPVGWPTLFSQDGEPFDFLSITYQTSGGKVCDSQGKELAPRDLHEPGLSTVARLGLQEAELTHRGSVGQYLLVTLLAVFNMFQICFPGLMFRWSIMWHVRDPYGAEPSDFYIFMERAEWVLLTGVAAVLYWLAMTVIHEQI